LPDICLANKTCEKALEMKEEYDKCVITFTAIFLLNLAIILAILGQLFEKKGRKLGAPAGKAFLSSLSLSLPISLSLSRTCLFVCFAVVCES